eukprot:SAG22_NODE_28_length_28728_cov_19.603619_11_plen_163_part_00
MAFPNSPSRPDTAGTQLFVIDKSFTVTIWSLQPNVQAKATGKGSEQVYELTWLAVIDPYVFQKEGAQQASELTLAARQQREYLAYVACFHPGRTLLGSQPSLVIGMLSGEVVKCNNNRLIEGTSASGDGSGGGGHLVIGRPPLPLAESAMPLSASAAAKSSG